MPKLVAGPKSSCMLHVRIQRLVFEAPRHGSTHMKIPCFTQTVRIRNMFNRVLLLCGFLCELFA